MKYLKVLDDTFIAYDANSIWSMRNGEFVHARVDKNPEFMKQMLELGVEIKARTFEMSIPRGAKSGEEHMALALYLGTINDKERKL
jgi:hypothetical protein